MDEIYLVYTNFINMVKQEPIMKKLLPLDVLAEGGQVQQLATSVSHTPAVYTYEPAEREILDEIIPRFTALQVYHAILESLASEHAAVS